MAAVRSCAIAWSLGSRNPTTNTLPTPIRLIRSMAGLLPVAGCAPRSEGRTGLPAAPPGSPRRDPCWPHCQHQQCHFVTSRNRGVPARDSRRGGHLARDGDGATRAPEERLTGEAVLV